MLDHCMKTFYEKLQAAWRSTGSMVCVGLDPQLSRLPEGLRGAENGLFAFNRAIIDATLKECCAYKMQFAYYAAEGRLRDLEMTFAYLREVAPGHVHILDAKRNDIGTTAQQYAREAFVHYGADAVTVNAYMGGDTLIPFSEDPAKGAIVLCKTSNAGSAELQNLELASGGPLYLEVARKAAASWNGNGNLCLVVGATYPDELAQIRAVVGDMPILVPGIGAQGGDLAATLAAGLDCAGWGVLINSSRGIIYASAGSDFAVAAGAAAAHLNAQCRELQQQLRSAQS